MDHRCSVFRHSCLKVPVDPFSKMPKTAYERRKKSVTAQCSIDSVSTSCSASTADIDAEKLKDFYRSIPDYNDINHLPNEEFYSTLNNLRQKKKIMFEIAVEHIDDTNHHNKECSAINDTELIISIKNNKPRSKRNGLRKYSADKKGTGTERQPSGSKDMDFVSTKIAGTSLLKPTRKCTDDIGKYSNNDDTKLKPELPNIDVNKKDRPKRVQSACSISWNDAKVECKNEIDEKFDKFFDGKKYCSPRKVDIGDEFRTRSMPTSPLRMRKGVSPQRRRRTSITIPKPFKMTERDEDERVVNELRSLRKSFSDDLLHQKFEREKRQFRANPVPIESRIPLYDKILEDQAMRRAITKINSEADLRAQMKPFSFTKREEKSLTGICDRATAVLPKTKKKKRFKARPVPKNLFSNYFYDKMKEDEFFRGVNRRIRAEELLRQAQLPGTMAARDRSRLSTPAAHSDLPIDPSPSAPSVASLERQRCTSPSKNRKNRQKLKKEEFISTSPQPFRFSTEERAAKKMEDMVRKIYLESKSTTSRIGDVGTDDVNRAYSALDLRAAASGRSNLAALLRAEAVRRKFEMEALQRLEEQRRKAEMKHRDRLLRSKPAWHLVKNNHEEDIAMRLQTRRDEERLRREEFLHEMELMYGRVQQQPLLFERYYAPRSYIADSIQLSPRKTKRRSSKSNAHFCSPIRSRKVSINDTAETFNGAVAEYLNRIDNNDDISVSDVLDSDRAKR